MPPNQLTLALLCSPRTRSPTLTLGHRCALSGPARSASGLSALFPRRERPTHVTRDKVSVWWGVSRGTWPGRCRVPIEGTPDPHSPGVHTAGCATGTGPIACAVASPAAMTRELRATAPPGRAVPSPLRACGAALARPSPRRHWPYAALGRLVDVSRDPVRRKGDGPKRRRANDAHRRAGPKPSKLATPSGDEAQDGEEASATLVLLECTRLSLRAPPLTSHSSQTQ
jgi:hypothetical protein